MSMAFEVIKVEVSEEGWATVLFNRPEKMNTLSMQLRRELDKAVAALEADPAVRILILSGVGAAFTAGLDLDEWDSTGLPAAGAYELDVVATLERFSGPVIAAINGLAMTGGLEIALACDVVLASANARFADTHVHVGLLPGWGGSVRLARCVGLHRAKELALTGRFFSADEAQSWGLVSRVVAPDDLLAESQNVARAMLKGVPTTLRAYKELLDRGSQVTLPQARQIERAMSIANNSPVSRDEIQVRLQVLRERHKTERKALVKRTP
jgi:enoyl-CoA hydratase